MTVVNNDFNQKQVIFFCIDRWSECNPKIGEAIYLLFKKIATLFYPQSQHLSLKEKTLSHLVLPIKTSSETFDHKLYYRICDTKVYFKPIAAPPEAPWKEIPFKGHPSSITADGNNLIVIDQNRQVHYAKTDDIQFHLTENSWEVTRFYLKWHKNWFNMYFLAPVINFFKPAHLYVMENARSVAVSHKGSDTLYYTDRGGKKHLDPFIGTTTLYMLSPSGTRIFFADPWLCNKFENEITGPEDGRFVAEAMDASASTIFLSQRAKNAEGQEINKFYTRFADFDNIGNPLLPSTYDIHNKIPFVRILPAEDWLEQPSILLREKAHLSKRIAILQTGRGQAQRQLRVEGTDREGMTGVYVKMIYDKEWAFERTGHPVAPGEFASKNTPWNGYSQISAIARDYKGFVKTKLGNISAELKKFSSQGLNERGLHTELEMSIHGKKVICPLYARRGIEQFFKHEHTMKWTLIIPREGTNRPKIQKVKLEETHKEIRIIGKNFKASFKKDPTTIDTLKRPPPPMRLLLSGVLNCMKIAKVVLKMSRRIVDKISNDSRTLRAQERLLQAIHLGDIENTKLVMQRLVKENPQLAPTFLVNFLSHSQILAHLHEIMRGANVLIDEKKPSWFELLKKELKKAKPRISSHEHKTSGCYSLETPLFGELLFWLDKNEKLRIQFEAHSLGSLFNAYCHFMDYLKYKLRGQQQSLYGVSYHTEEMPLKIDI